MKLSTSLAPVPMRVTYPNLKHEGRDCTAYPAPPEEVLLAFADGSRKTIGIDEFRALPRNEHLIIRDEFWDAFGGDVEQKKVMAYLYGE